MTLQQFLAGLAIFFFAAFIIWGRSSRGRLVLMRRYGDAMTGTPKVRRSSGRNASSSSRRGAGSPRAGTPRPAGSRGRRK